jgi:hypothetical protein
MAWDNLSDAIFDHAQRHPDAPAPIEGPTRYIDARPRIAAGKADRLRLQSLAPWQAIRRGR